MRRTILAIALALAACSSSGSSNQKAPDKTPAPSPSPAAAVDVQGRRIDVAVDREGFKPAQIPVKANEQVTLVFTRTEAVGCGEQVQIPSLHVLKDLPVGQPVAVPFKAEAAGEVAFACGMDMMHGAIVVSN